MKRYLTYISAIILVGNTLSCIMGETNSPEAMIWQRRVDVLAKLKLGSATNGYRAGAYLTRDSGYPLGALLAVISETGTNLGWFAFPPRSDAYSLWLFEADNHAVPKTAAGKKMGATFPSMTIQAEDVPSESNVKNGKRLFPLEVPPKFSPVEIILSNDFEISRAGIYRLEIELHMFKVSGDQKEFEPIRLPHVTLPVEIVATDFKTKSND